MTLFDRFSFWFSKYITADNITQAAHSLLGSTAVYAPLAIWPHLRWPAVLLSVLFWAYVFAKEFVWDIRYEKATVKNGVFDTVFLLSGNVLAWISFIYR